MTAERQPARAHIVWVYTQALLGALDQATWIETAQELGRQGWDVTLVTADPPDTAAPGNVQWRPLGKPRLYLLGQAVFHARVAWLLLRGWRSIDVALFHEMSTPWLLPLAAVGRLLRRPRPLFVMDTRTLPMVAPARATWRDRLRGAFYGWMNRFGNRWADGRTVITRRMAKVLRVPTDKLLGTWPSAVDLPRFSAARGARRWPGPGEPVRLIYTGSLVPERNLTGLARAVQEASSRGMAFEFTAIGSGDGEAELRALAAHLDGRLRVLSPVSHEEVPRVLATAHVGVLPFPDEERFRVSSPIKMFEYMGAGMPVLATRIVCHTDVVGGDDYVFWAEDPSLEGLVEALERVWRRREELETMGTRAASAAARYTWAASAGRLGEALRQGIERLAGVQGRKSERRVVS